MRYRGFEITSCPDDSIEHRDSETDRDVICSGHFCQVYPSTDEDYAYQLDCFCLAVGYELDDDTQEALERGIINYVDDMYGALSARKAEIERDRRSDLVGRLVAWIGESENGEELYHTLTEVIGMTDDEIREIGFHSLYPYFDHYLYENTIAEYFIDIGSENTRTGNWYLTFDQINKRYHTNLPTDKAMTAELVEILKRGYPFTVKDAFLADGGILISFNPEICPNVARDWDQGQDEGIVQSM